MKKIIRKIIVWKLNILTKILLLREKPEVIAVTGSAGKTTAKELIREFLDIDFDVLATEEGYNTEIGAPLSVFSKKVPKNLSNIFSWFMMLMGLSYESITKKDLADKIIIEMGADKLGDIKYLSKLFRPQKGVILTILPVHLESFKNIQNIAKEKGMLAEILPEDGTLFLNGDDELVRQIAKRTKARVIFFGTKKNNDIIASNVSVGLNGMKFDFSMGGSAVPISVKIYGKHMIYPLLAAISVALSENIPLKKIVAEIKNIKPYKGRMNVIEGINESILIDDSYNANPKSMEESLDFLYGVTGRKIAVLGNMNELGDYERVGHELVGKKASQIVDILITVGKVAENYIAGEARSKVKYVHSFTLAEEAGDWLLKNIKKGDIVLFKGSQNNVRLENAVEKVMAHPENKKNILVRQSEFWKKVK